MYETSFIFTFASLTAFFIAFAAATPSGDGEVIWYASHVEPYPTISASIFAPLFLACSKLSITNIPAPSPITNPPLSLSNGIDALVLFLLVDNALIFVKPAIAIGVIDDSQPPVIAISA